MRYAAAKRGGPQVDFTPEELQTCMKNQAPGSPGLAILSFEGSFHGRTFATLSATRSKPLHKVDVCSTGQSSTCRGANKIGLRLLLLALPLHSPSPSIASLLS